MKLLKNSFFIGLTALSISAGALAQTPPPPPAAASMQNGHGKMGDHMKDHMAEHLAQLHDKLKLSTTQEPAWKTFTDAITPAMPPAPPAPPPDKSADKLSTPEQMEKMLDRMKEHEAQMQKHLAAVKTFYAVLTPEQQKTFDEAHRRMQHHMHEAMEHRGMPHGDHPPADKK